MTIGVINRGRSLSQIVDLRFNHGVFILLVILFRPFHFAHAQPGNFPSPVPPPPPSYPLRFVQKFNPPLSIIMVALVSAFFTIGIFSVYIYQCSGQRSGRLFLIPPAASVMGGGRRSRRAPLGLEKQVIETFPTFLYSAVKGLKVGEGSLECAVCLNEFEDDDTLRLIPKCNHVFHPDCIGEWLAAHTTCPLCRANLVPKPGNLPLRSDLVVEPDNVSDQENQQSITTHQTRDEVAIRVADDNTNPDRETEETQVNLQNPVQKNRLPRSRSSWQFARLFPRSHSTGHSLVQPGENCQRFTLRVPEEIRSQLLNTHVQRAQSCVAFPRASSSRRAYRSRSVGTGRTENDFHYELFDHAWQPNNFGCTITLPSIARSGSVQSTKEAGGTGSDEVNATTLQKSSRSTRSPFDRLFSGMGDGNNQNDSLGERSSDRLRLDSHG